MFTEKELTALISLLRNAPTTYGEAHNLHPTVVKLIGTQQAVKAGWVMMLLEADEAAAVTEGRKTAAPQPSGPQVPAGALSPSVVS